MARRMRSTAAGLALAVFHCLLSSACAVAENPSLPARAAAAPWPQAGIGNASELELFLRRDAMPVELDELAFQRGCTPALCGVDQVEYYELPAPDDCTPGHCSTRIDAVEWNGDASELATLEGTRIPLRHASLGPELALDTEPLAAWRVRAEDQVWGLCMEFAHEGLGRSGHAQRWVTLLLVPYRDAAPAATAWRVTGYWAGCAALRRAASTHAVDLPLIEPASASTAGLMLTPYRCDPSGCAPAPESQALRVDEQGRLWRSD